MGSTQSFRENGGLSEGCIHVCLCLVVGDARISSEVPVYDAVSVV